MANPGITLEALLNLAERAVNGERQLLVQLFRELQRLSMNANAPAEERALAEVLGKVLMGEREPDLSGLHPEAAEEIGAWLRRLEVKGR